MDILWDIHMPYREQRFSLFFYSITVNESHLNKQVYYFSRHPWMTVRNIKKREECLKVGRVELSAAAAASFDGLDTQCQNN